MQPADAGCSDDDGRRAVKVRISLIAIACAAVTAALGVGSASAADPKSYCIDGATVTVSNGTGLGLLQQLQLDVYAMYGGAYTVSFPGANPPANESFLAALGDLGVIKSAFQLPGSVFHPVLTGACPVAPVPDPTPAGGTPATAAAAVAAPQSEEGIFLCYSKWQVDPGVWTASEAPWLLLTGQYWKPYAVLGGDSSTQLGGYSLVCNPGKVTASASTGAVEGGGWVVGDPSQLNVYPVLG
jgi:hypothetical protein